MSDAKLLSLVTEAAVAAGAVLSELPHPAPVRTWPELKDVFDRVDEPVAAVLRDRLGTARPGVEWVDEQEPQLSGSGECWVVDAIDGAVQYLQGLPQWCVSVTLVRDGRPVLAVIHSTMLGETYTALSGGGAFRNGARIAPSAKDDLGVAMLATSHPPFVARQPGAIADTARSLAALLPAVAAVRNLGPTSWQVADVGAGRLDGFWEYGRDDTNLLGAALIAGEAGVVVTDATGQPWKAGADSFVAAPPALHGQILELLSSTQPT